MGYWLLISAVFIFLILSIILAWYALAKKKDRLEFGLCVFVVCVFFAFGMYFGIDIPDALGGGQKVYVDKFPDIIQMMSVHIAYADGQRFLDFTGYNPDKYEQNAKYCITYTKLTKTILRIEKTE